MKYRRGIGVLTILTLLFWHGSVPVQGQVPTVPKYLETPEGIVGEIYKAVSFKAGQPQPDWERVRSMFLDNALVVLRVTRDSTAILTVQGFIDDFIRFIDRSPAKQNGFEERIVRMKPMVFGNIAQIFVVYEAQILGLPRPPQQGLDSWELVQNNGRWWIVAVTNEVPSKDRPLPKEFQE
jgi:hypothetical protein